MGDDAGFAGAGRFHFNQLALTGASDLFDDRAGVFVIHVDGGFFDGLVTHTVDLLEQNLRARDRKLEPFAAHVLDQNAHLQFATTGNLEGVAAGGVGDFDRDVGFGFLHQALADHAGLDFLAVTTGQRAVVDAESHGDGGRIDRLGRDGFVHRCIGQRVGHGCLGHTGDGNDVTCFGHVDGCLL